jgi:hypothetical protein
MKKAISTALIMIALQTTVVSAEIISVSGPTSTAGYAAEIIVPPAEVLNATVTNMGQQGFDEAQGVVTTVEHHIDGGSIPAGTLVNSHMIFLNAPPGPNIYHNNVVWTFSGPIIGVMSDSHGDLEVASTPELGAPATDYPTVGFNNRGIEAADHYTISGSQLTLSMGVDPDAGDWIRVVTLAANIEKEIDIDIKPGSCPNPFNPKSQGRVPVAIVATEDFDPTTAVDLSTIQLAGVSPIDADVIDSTQPGDYDPGDCYNCFNADDYLTDSDGDGIFSYEGDGHPDLVLYFDTQELVVAIGQAEKDACLELELTGETLDGVPIVGSDSIWIIKAIDGD